MDAQSGLRCPARTVYSSEVDMKEKISRLARQEGIAEETRLFLSCDSIALEVERGKKAEGNFTVSKEGNDRMKFLVHTDMRGLSFPKEAFSGKENIVFYQYDTEGLRAGEIKRGNIFLITDCGERTIPVSVTVSASCILTAKGKINDLYRFFQLAKTDFKEAVRIFHSREFEEVFLQEEEEKRLVYRALVKSESREHALEEFLIAEKKKGRTFVKAKNSNYNLGEIHESKGGSFLLELTQEGWFEAEVKVKSSFLSTEAREISADDFEQGKYSLKFMVNPQKMKDSEETGRICITNLFFTLELFVHAKKKEMHRVNFSREGKLAQFSYTRNYLEFRMGRMEVSEYVSRERELLNRLPKKEMIVGADFFKLHLALASNVPEVAKNLVEEMDERFSESRYGSFPLRHTAEKKREEEPSVLEFCAYVYLKACYLRDAAAHEQARVMISDYYHQGHKNAALLWLLIYVEKGIDIRMEEKRDELLGYMDKDLLSPVFYFELLSIYKENPDLFTRLTPPDVRMLLWAVRQDFLEKEMAEKVTILLSNEKELTPALKRLMILIYQKYPSEVLLSAMVSLFIRADRTGEEYFPWYEKGVLANLPVTELYEYYMYSLSKKEDWELPRPVLTYFQYENHLPEDLLEKLYACLVRHKKDRQKEYLEYLPKMQDFAKKMLLARKVSKNLCLLYEEFLDVRSLTGEYLRAAASIMFVNEITVRQDGIRHMLFVHDGMEKEEEIFLSDGRAYADLLLEDKWFFFVDAKGNYYAKDIDFQKKKLLHYEEEIEYMFSQGIYEPLAIVYLYHQMGKEHTHLSLEKEIKGKICNISGVSKKQKKRARISLMKRFYEDKEFEQLENLLRKADLREYSPGERRQVIGYFLDLGMDREAMAGIEQYGSQGLDVKKVAYLLSRILTELSTSARKTFYAELAYELHTETVCDEVILSYLEENYNGTTKQMLTLWENLGGCVKDRQKLSERLLGQVLFTGEMLLESFPVFLSFYQEQSGGRLQREGGLLCEAYMNVMSYQILTNQLTQVKEEFYEILKEEGKKASNRLWELVCLKYLSQKESLSKEEETYANYEIFRMVRENVLLPFLCDFAGKTKLPYQVECQSFVECHAPAGTEVFIRYHKENEECWTEKLEPVFEGIFVKKFLLFEEERVYYQFIQKKDGREGISEEKELCAGRRNRSEENPYGLLNAMQRAQKERNKTELQRLMLKYMEMEYEIRRFRTLL